MFDWLRELYEIRAEFRERSRVCASCETLRVELAATKIREQRLIERVLYPEASPRNDQAGQQAKVIVPPKNIPWAVRRQMLEKADRDKAVVINEQKEAARVQAEFDRRSAEIKAAAIGESPSVNGPTIVEGSQVEFLEKEMGIS